MYACERLSTPIVDAPIEQLSTGYRVISLFSGCGGFDLGANNSGAEVVFANDVMRDACDTLDSFFGGNIYNENISKIKAFPKAEIVIGGYPCQSFSMGGKRNPEADDRTNLFQEFARCVDAVNPLYFIAENVSGLQSLNSGQFLEQQLLLFKTLGAHGYNLSYQLLNARDYGVPQSRKRLFIVGVRKDLNVNFSFPTPTHAAPKKLKPSMHPFSSHGEVIKDLPLNPDDEFYELESDQNFAWYYMSRNRKALWDGPSYTVVANWRHITLHPASPSMELEWSNLADGYKQRWRFTDRYEHLEIEKSRMFLDKPRRLSWRECARIQTFPDLFMPAGSVQSKFTQIGNAVPPLLAQKIITHLLSGDGLA